MKKQFISRVDLGCSPVKKPQLASVLDDSDDMDISVLQQPLYTAKTGFQEANRAFEGGTNEVRRLLIQECSIIYECNVCRNMFRSLANFISHKRVFCKTSCLSSSATASCGGGAYYNGLNQQSSSSTIIQTKNQDIEKRSRSMGSSPTRTEGRSATRGSLRDLSGVIERLRREKESNLKDQNFNSGGDAVLQLESVPTNNHAVYQTVKRQEEDKDSIKTEVNEVHHLLNNVQVSVGPDGKAITKHSYADTKSDANNDETTSDNEDGVTSDNDNIVCEHCSFTFRTEKTLKIHVQKQHLSSTYVFQCPACSLTFMNAAAVIRHLSKEHKKPTRRIRLMRDSFYKRNPPKGDVQTKGPSRELKRLQMNDTIGSAAASSVAAENSGENRKVMSSCIYCEKSFERRAALSSHLLNCRAKQAALQKPVQPQVRRHKQSLPTSPSKTIVIEDEEEEHMKMEDDEQKVMKEKKDDTKDEGTEQQNNTELLNKLFADLDEEKQDKSLDSSIKTINLDMMESSNAEIVQSSDSEHDEPQNSLTNEVGSPSESNNKTKDDKLNSKPKKTRHVPLEKQLKCRCKICHKQFNALSNLRRHISMFHYRASRFGCKICDYRAFRRYDIVNHLGFVHKMEGERDQLASEYVITHDCKYSKDDVEGDIILVNEEAKPAATGKEYTLGSEEIDNVNGISETKTKVVKTYEKRVKRKSEASKATESKDQNEPPPSKIKHRRLNNLDEGSSTKDGEKRPIRKRVKAENKDFVYDLSRLLKSDANATSSTLASTPIATVASTASSGPSSADVTRPKRNSNSNLFIDSNDTEQQKSEEKSCKALIKENSKEDVRGSTRRIMLKLVNQGLAVSATLPEMPAERPQMRPRQMSLFRSCENSTNATKSMENTASGSNSSDSFIEKIAKRTAAAANISSDKSAINNLIRKVDAALLQSGVTSNDTINNTSKNNTQSIPAEASQKLKKTFGNASIVTGHMTPNGSLTHPQQEQAKGEVTITPNSGPFKRITTFPPLPPLPPPPPIQACGDTTLDSLLRTALQN